MSDEINISLEEAQLLAERAFVKVGVAEDAARSTARALVCAERDGQAGHGLSRVASYCAQCRVGKIRTDAKPLVAQVRQGAVMVDAAHGFAYPALDLAIAELCRMTPETGIAIAGVKRSHHVGQAGAHVEKLADEGFIALLFANTPKAIAFWGGAAPMMGTNPIAFAAPMGDAPSLVIDLALSVAARGKIVAAHKEGASIPAGWAFDEDGAPTTDAAAALRGSLAPLGGAKGAALAMMVEILAAPLTGAYFGFEASSFLDSEGAPPNVGCVLLAIDPGLFAGNQFTERMKTLAAALGDTPGARFPGEQRLKNRERVKAEGLTLSALLYEELAALAGDK